MTTREGFLRRLFTALREAPEPGTERALVPTSEAPLPSPVNEPSWVPPELAPAASRRGFLNLAGRGASAVMQARRAPLVRAGEFLTGRNVDPLIDREVGGYMRGLNDLIEGGRDVPEDAGFRLLRANQNDLNSYDLYGGVAEGSHPLDYAHTALQNDDPGYFSNLLLRDLSRRWQLGSPDDTAVLRSVVERGIGQPLDDVFRPYRYHSNVWNDYGVRDVAQDVYRFGDDPNVPLSSEDWFRNLTSSPQGRPSLHSRYTPTLEPHARGGFDEALGEAVDRGWVDENAYMRAQGYDLD
jgi:hypothetical protein